MGSGRRSSRSSRGLTRAERGPSIQAPGGRSHPLPPARGLPLARSAARLSALGHGVRPLAALAKARRLAASRPRAGHPLARGEPWTRSARSPPRHSRQPERENGGGGRGARLSRRQEDQGPLAPCRHRQPRHAPGRAGHRRQPSRRRRGAAVMVQAVERHPTIESFTADESYQRQAEAAARKLLGRDLHVTAKPATAQKKASRRSPSAGASSAPSRGLASAACSPKSTRKPSPAPRRGSGAR